MQEDRQSRIHELVQSALALAPEERASYLSVACPDNELLEEVTRVLSHLPSSVEPTRVPEAQDRRIGQSFGNYRILRRIGAGGMGEVYLAFDIRLGRQIALKFLPAHTASDEKLVRRFQQEARAASALNHPNILTIFEVGKFEHEHYIASEFVDGATLRARLRQGRLELYDALEIITQVASALVAAHSAGVIHRDLKPTNVMLRPDGYVKVIDFGLAKRTSRAYGELNDESVTQPGTMLGTADYMSPEQARGEEVDARSDLWSLGVIFYEMLSGGRPFEGETHYQVVARILESEPKPIDPALGLPVEIEQVLTRCLQKEREQRYESAAQLYSALRETRRALNLSSIASTPVFGRPKKRSRRWYGIPAIICLLVAIAAGWWFARGREFLFGPEPFEYSEMKKVTYRGQVKLASISPDGRYMAFVTGSPHHEELCVKPLDSSYDSTLVPVSDTDYQGVTFSSDNQYVYFVTRTGEYGKLHKVAITGGDSQLVESDVDGPAALNPVSSELAFRRDAQGSENLVLTGGRFGSNGVQVALGSTQIIDHKLAWRPSGDSIALFVYPSTAESPMQLELFNVVSRNIKTRVAIPGWQAVSQAGWLPNGHDLIVPVQRAGETDDEMQLLEVCTRSGRTRSLTAGPYGYRGASLSRDGKQLVTVRRDKQTRFWFGDTSDLSVGRTRAADSGQYDSVSWTDQGGLIAQANRGDGMNAWLIESPGKMPKMLTRGPHANRDPVWIPHQNAIAVVSERNGNPGLWRFDLSDGRYRLLARGPEVIESPICTPDGKTILYTSWNLSKPSIWSVSIQPGSTPKPLLRNARNAALSPDSTRLAVEELLDEKTPHWNVAIYEFPSLKFLQLALHFPSGSDMKWSPDGKGLNYIATDDQGTSNIWFWPLVNGKASPVTSFEEDQIFDYAWSPDGRQLACLRGRVLSDAFDLTRK
jgi:Tol biopolymer transport system component